MKILLVHELFMPDQVGGGEVLVYELAKGLIKKGHEVKVFTTGKPEIKQYENIPTVRININRYLFNFSFLKIKKLAKDYDIIQSFSYNAAFPSYLASKLGKKPVICTILGVYGKTWKKLRKLSFFWRMMEKVQLNRKFNATVFLSPLSREIGHEIGMKMAPNFIIPSGVNLSNTHPNLKKEKFVLFVGRLSKQKGLDLLIDTAVLLPEIKFVLVGEGPEKQKLQQKATKNVSFLPPQYGDKLFNLFGKAQIFCLPSYAEGFPVVIVEAMASGCAIVSTLDYPYHGQYVPNRCPNELATTIEKLYNNEKLLQKYSNSNIKDSRDYTWNNFVNKTEQVYHWVLNQKTSEKEIED